MATTLKAAVDDYLRAKSLARGTRNEYFSTLRKWEQWGGGVPIKEMRRKDVRAFLDWVYERAVAEAGTNPGRTANGVPVLPAAIRGRWLVQAMCPEQIGGRAVRAEVGRTEAVCSEGQTAGGSSAD